MSGTRALTWREIVSSFNVVSARDLAAMDVMERHQDIRDRVGWLAADEDPLALLFISHRWQTPRHPDPDASDLRSIQTFLGKVASATHALMVDRAQRLGMMESLTAEGDLQAEEIARRMLGFGPFADGTAAKTGSEAKAMVREAFRTLRGDKIAFGDWLLRRIGVWLDFVCMPQKPLGSGDEDEFRRSLDTLDSLVMSSTVVALRRPDDDYATRGWCASEFFLASGRSFARGVFVDVDGMEHGRRVLLEPGPVTQSPASSAAAEVLAQSYALDAGAFSRACEEWSGFDGAFIDVVPPAAWAEYRSLQGSTFYPASFDPNPFRRVHEAIRAIEQALVAHWLMSDRERRIDLAKEVAAFLEREGVRCTEATDHVYLGLLIAGHGWVEAFRPLFEEGRRRYVKRMPAGRGEGSIPSLPVALRPLPSDLRARFVEVSPASAGTWHSRLSVGSGSNAREQAAVDAVRNGLAANPPEFRFFDSTDQPTKGSLIERL